MQRLIPIGAEMNNDVTGILKSLGQGSESAAAELFPLVYGELRRQAGQYLRNERRDITLQPTALVHETYLKLVDAESADWNDRAHFCRIAARAMRQILVDHARKRSALKRGSDRRRLTLSDSLGVTSGQVVDLLALDEALAQLSELAERQGKVVELRFFGGLTTEEVAGILDVSVSTVESDWRMARAWLHRELSGNRPC